MLCMRDLDLSDQRVLIRLDLNVPIDRGVLTSGKRIDASLETIRMACESGARVLLMSHWGRPQEGIYDAGFSLAPVVDYLSAQLNKKIGFSTDYLSTPPVPERGEVVLLENIRFNVGEKSNDPCLSQQYAGLCDIFVMDAFGTAHRAQASTLGLATYAKIACCGPLLQAEIEALEQSFETPVRPMIAIVGGAKVSTKLTVLESLSGIVDQLIPGGGIANTFIAASGYQIGRSLMEPDLIVQAQSLIRQAKQQGAAIPIPTDVVVAKRLSDQVDATVKSVSEVAEDDMILDIGPATTRRYCEMLVSAGTIIWNGPVGVFEFEPFSLGTSALGTAIATSPAFSVAGGGDTVAAIEKFTLEDRICYISTGGGAFLEYLEGKTLPVISALESRSRS